MRVRAALLLLALVLALSACAPTAQWLRDRLDTGGGATLDFAERGVTFHPGDTAAYDVHLSLRGEELVLLGGPETCVVDEQQRYLDCALGAVTDPVTVHLSGRGVLGSAKYTRTPGSLNWAWAYTPIGP